MWKSDTKYLVLAIALLAAISTQVVAQEAALLEVLRSDATFAEKSAACRQLTRIATKESVPTLASLLTDEKLSHMARYALEPIKDASVDRRVAECPCRSPGDGTPRCDRQPRRATGCQGP